MTIALKAGSTAENTVSNLATVTVANAAAIAIGDVIIAAFKYENTTSGQTVSSISDTQGNTYTALTSVSFVNAGPGGYVVIYFAVAKAASIIGANTTSLTWSSASVGSNAVTTALFNGFVGTPTLGANAIGNDATGSTSAASDSFTTTAQPALIVQTMIGGATVSSYGGGNSVLLTDANGWGTGYQVVSSTGLKSPTIVMGANDIWASAGGAIYDVSSIFSDGIAVGPVARKLPNTRGAFRTFSGPRVSTAVAIQPLVPETAFPDWLARPAPTIVQSFALPPAPEGALPLDWAPDRYPDSITRPSLPASSQEFTAGTKPERSASPADVHYPDAVALATLATSSQQFTTEIAAKPEGTLAADWQPAYPDRAIRLTLPPAAVPFVAFAPAPERTAPIAATAYPDRVERLVPDLRQAWTTSPAAERTSPLASATYPDAIMRLVADLRQAWTTSPRPERSLPLASASFPDAIVRLLPQEHQYASLWPFPLPGLLTGWWPTFPEMARAPLEPVYEQPVTTRAIAPERPLPLAAASYPDALVRLVPQEQEYAALWPFPLTQVTTGWWPSFPDSPRSLVQQVHEQPVTASPIAPERTSVLASASFPDAVYRPTPQEQQATALWPLLLVPLSSGWAPDYPDFVRGLWLGAHEQQSTTRTIRPERTLPMASSGYPDSIVRLMPELRQVLGQALIPPPPLTWGWTPAYPDRVWSLTAPPWLPWVPIQPPFPNLLLGPPRFTLGGAPILNFTPTDAPLLGFTLSDAPLQNFSETSYP